MNVDRMTASATASGASASAGWLRALEMTKPIANQQTRVLPVIIDELAEKFGHKPALLGEKQCLTFRALADRSNRYARWAIGQDLAKQAVVCLLMPNCPEYMAIWLGIARVGGVVALLNTKLVGASLAHCIDIVGPEHIIVASELIGVFADAQPFLTTDPKVWVHGGEECGLADIERTIAGFAGDRLSDAACGVPAITDRALLIYTSGTTGLPKAANVSHYRLLMWSLWFAGMMNTRSSDRMYNCLPMYHSIGGVVP